MKADSLDTFLSRRTVKEITGKSDATLWRWVKQGIFPAPHRLGPGSVAWSKSEIAAWIELTKGGSK